MENKSIIVTGGAGYIGSFMVRVLLERGYTPVIIDNLSRNPRDSVPEGTPFYQADVSDFEVLKSIKEQYDPVGVIHFAGYISMKESMEKPELYFEQNFIQTHKLLNNIKALGINNIMSKKRNKNKMHTLTPQKNIQTKHTFKANKQAVTNST